MRKILIAVLLVLLIVLAYFTIFQGISLGTFRILSTGEIVQLNSDLDNKIDEANRKIKIDLQDRQTGVEQAVKTLATSKDAYYREANTSTDAEIERATTEEIYDIEYLWLRVGGHARSEGVNIEMVINQIDTSASGKAQLSNLSFSVVGQYFGIMNFVSALEDDSELSFRIENFNMLPESGNNLVATFNVNGISITQETVSANTGAATPTTDTTANTTTDTSTTSDMPMVDSLTNSVVQ